MKSKHNKRGLYKYFPIVSYPYIFTFYNTVSVLSLRGATVDIEYSSVEKNTYSFDTF